MFPVGTIANILDRHDLGFSSFQWEQLLIDVIVMIQTTIILLCSVLFCDILSIPIQLLYPFGAQYGDSGLGKGDEMTSSALQISMSFPFFNNSHDYLFVSMIFEII